MAWRGKKNNHTFSVLAFRESPYLQECILSLKQQTVKSDIFISTATPCESIKKISERFSIPFFINYNSGGIASDWSFAYEKSRTKYVTLAHQDDIYLPGYTEFCLSAAEKVPESLIIFTDYKELHGEKKVSFHLNFLVKKFLLFPFIFKRSIGSFFLRQGMLSFGSPISCPSVMYHRDNIGNFEFSNEFCCNMDWDAWIRLSHRQGSFVYVNKALILHRLHKDSQTLRQIKNTVRVKEEEKIFMRLWLMPVAKILAFFYRLALKSNMV